MADGCSSIPGRGINELTRAKVARTVVAKDLTVLFPTPITPITLVYWVGDVFQLETKARNAQNNAIFPGIVVLWDFGHIRYRRDIVIEV
jgi:hypothetical protein